MKIRREWAMPNKNTFRCPPIWAFVDYYLQQSKVSVDPFARNFQGCTHTNDLNPNTSAQYHMDSLEFLKMIRNKGIRPDLVVFDPPYSPERLKKSYNNIGKKMTGTCALRCANWVQEKNILAEICSKNATALSFGWSSTGMGAKRGFSIEEILLVCHGGGHPDTICVAERKAAEQLAFELPEKQDPA
uniref:Methyltransferase n=1 Tax=viral metagenome TaxID=1070528 RepID=A0A6M3K5S5_9ZZZZ